VKRCRCEIWILYLVQFIFPVVSYLTHVNVSSPDRLFGEALDQLEVISQDAKCEGFLVLEVESVGTLDILQVRVNAEPLHFLDEGQSFSVQLFVDGDGERSAAVLVDNEEMVWKLKGVGFNFVHSFEAGH